MKKVKEKIGISVAIIIPVAIWIFVGWFYYTQLRGATAIFNPAEEDIVSVIERSKPGENKTNFPLKLPNGFSLSIYAQGLNTPRALQLDPNNNLLVSLPKDGKVVRILDTDKDGVGDKQETLIEKLTKPNGIAVRIVSGKSGDCTQGNCQLFVAEENKVSLYTFNETGGVWLVRKLANLPTGGNHTSRSLLFVPDALQPADPTKGTLLVAVGSSCNVCSEKEKKRGTVLAMNPDGSNQRIFADGLRNTVFMARNPKSGEVWGTDMGRDLLGDDLPPDEINIIKEGSFYGWPYCFGNQIQDVDFDSTDKGKKICEGSVVPAVNLQAHSAPLGIAFVPENIWSKDFDNSAIVALHGSWNRSVPAGYKLVQLKCAPEGGCQTKDFITGWVKDKTALGRPVDILISSDGVGYISDDKAGVVYKLTYKK